MNISYVGGGLGNQVLQYIFARWLEIHKGEPVYLDHSHTQGGHYHNGFDLPLAFPNVKLRLWQNQLDDDQWQEMLNTTKLNFKNFPLILAKQCKSLTIIHEYSYNFPGDLPCKITDIPLQYDVYSADLAQYQDENLYFHGVWKHKSWLFDEKVHPMVKEELQFSPFTEVHNIAYGEQIQNSNSVSVHIRRGDVLELGLFTGYRYYQQATKKIRQHIQQHREEKPVFFLFSDHLDWCREHRDSLGFLPEDQLVFVDGNQPGSGTQHRDLQLMSLCRHKIITNSTFSLVAHYLSEHQSYISPFLPGDPKVDWVCQLG